MAGAKSSNPKLWTLCYVVTLVAWLDYCVKHHIQFEESILQRLNEARQSPSNAPYHFTIKQVRNKVIDISRTNGKRANISPLPGYKQILGTGYSLFLPWLGENKRKMVEKAVRKYEKAHLPHRSLKRATVSIVLATPVLRL